MCPSWSCLSYKRLVGSECSLQKHARKCRTSIYSVSMTPRSLRSPQWRSSFCGPGSRHDFFFRTKSLGIPTWQAKYEKVRFVSRCFLVSPRRHWTLTQTAFDEKRFIENTLASLYFYLCEELHRHNALPSPVP